LKVLLDSCISSKTEVSLMNDGYDVEWTGNWSKDPGDKAILQYAHQHKRILVTLDKDFGELVIVYQKPHSGILRLVDLSVKEQARICQYVLKNYGEELLNGAIITSEINRIRVRPSESKE